VLLMLLMMMLQVSGCPGGLPLSHCGWGTWGLSCRWGVGVGYCGLWVKAQVLHMQGFLLMPWLSETQRWCSMQRWYDDEDCTSDVGCTVQRYNIVHC
jgi:hypothetical protein